MGGCAVSCRICGSNLLPWLVLTWVLAGCATAPPACPPPNVLHYNGIPLASVEEDAAAKRGEVDHGHCALYVYQDALMTNSWFEFDRLSIKLESDQLPTLGAHERCPWYLTLNKNCLPGDEATWHVPWVTSDDTARWTWNDEVYARWILRPGRYRLRAQATGPRGGDQDYRGALAEVSVECTAGGLVLFDDGDNGASLSIVQRDVALQAIRNQRLSAGPRTGQVWEGYACRPEDAEPCGLQGGRVCFEESAHR